MFAHRSTIYREAVLFFHSFSEKLQDILPDASHIMPLAERHAAYLEEICCILESPEQDQEQLFHKAGHAYAYGMLAVLTALFQAHRLSLADMTIWEDMVHLFIRTQEQRFHGRKKILVLSIRAGHGHTSAAKAIIAGMHEKYGYDTHILLKELPVDLNTFYETTVKHTPKVYQWLFDTTDSKEGMALVHGFGYPMFAGKLDTLIEEERPDVIVSTYSFPGINHWIKRSLRKQKRHIPYIAVITDSISIHEMWYGKDVDAYIVANDETKQVVVDKGYAASKVHVLGFPVHPQFYAPIAQKTAQELVGIHTDKMVFVMSVGTGSTMKDVEWVKHFEKQCGKFAQLVMVLGKNDALLEKLQKMNLGENVILRGWVSNMFMYMKAADVMITKAGGATVMECIAVQRPMIITKVLPGQEEGNAELVKKYHLGVVLGKKDEPLDAIVEMSASAEHLQKFQKGFAQATVLEGTYAICDYLQKVVKK